MHTLTQWLSDHPQAIWMAGISLVTMLIAGVAGTIAVVRLPADFFAQDKPKKQGPLRIALNVTGWLLILVGIAMLITPGPGAIVLLVGIVLAEFPGKQRFLHWLLTRGSILSGMNRLRARFNRPPFKVETPSPITTNHTPPISARV